MKAKGFMLIVIAILLSSIIIACASPPPPPTPSPTPTPTPAPPKPSYRWLFAVDHNEESPVTQGMFAFADRVAELSDNRIQVEVKHSGVLGDWVQTTREVMAGSIEMQCAPPGPVYDPRLNAVYIPYMIKGWEDAKTSLVPGGFLFDTLDTIGRQLGYVTLASMPTGFIGMGTSKLPPSPEDPDVEKPLKIRVWPAIPPEKMVDRLGYLVIAMPWSEVFTSMQTGTIDGYVGADSRTAYDLVRDVTSYWLDYRYFFVSMYFQINQELFDSLSQEDQEIVMRAALEQGEIKLAGAEGIEAESHELWKEFGVEVIKFTPEQLDKLTEVAVSDVWPELESIIGKVLMDEAIDYVKSIK